MDALSFARCVAYSSVSCGSQILIYLISGLEVEKENVSKMLLKAISLTTFSIYLHKLIKNDRSNPKLLARLLKKASPQQWIECKVRYNENHH